MPSALARPVHVPGPRYDRIAPVNRPQEDFLRCPTFEALYGGAAGGGKSWALLIAALRHVEDPNYRGIVLRREWAEGRRTLLVDAWKIYPHAGGLWNSSAKEWRFPSGAVVEIGHAEHEYDIKRYDGAAYQFVGFDELTHFLRSQYVYMISRLRSAHGIPLRLRGATNPGGVGHEWVLERFAPWLYPRTSQEHKGPWAEPADRLYFRRHVGGVEAWCSRSDRGAMGRAFFPALVSDNPMYAGTEYERNLDALDPVDRARLKLGDWMARPSAGAYFQRGMFEIVDACPADVTARVRYWDLAGTEGAGDWTSGLRLSRTPAGIFFVENVHRGRFDVSKLEAEIRTTLELDLSAYKNTALRIERDPAQAGKFQARHWVTTFAGYDVATVSPMADKIARAVPASSQASVGNIKLVRGTWNEAFIRELEAFPDGPKDQVDTLSGALAMCLVVSGKSTATGKRLYSAAKAGGF